MLVEVYSKKNKKVSSLEVADKVLSTNLKSDLVHQVLTSQLSNARKPIAHTLDRGEVSGGGKKPWRQKHTGRARHGSTRSPLWAHGGITFGPRNERDFSRNINKKMKRGALLSVLANKFKTGELFIIEDMTLENGKTKNMVEFLKPFFGEEAPNVLIVPKKGNKNVFFAARNIKNIKAIGAASVSIYDCLKHKNIFVEKEAFEEILKERVS